MNPIMIPRVNPYRKLLCAQAISQFVTLRDKRPSIRVATRWTDLAVRCGIEPLRRCRMGTLRVSPEVAQSRHDRFRDGRREYAATERRWQAQRKGPGQCT